VADLGCVQLSIQHFNTKIIFLIYKYALLIFILLLAPIGTNGQIDTLNSADLAPITISATPIATTEIRLPFSANTYLADSFQLLQPQSSLQDYIYQFPGVFSLNPSNFAQDLRISIRGFGARSAFGIRGIKIVVDDIPETTPDGQGQLDNLNLQQIQKIETLNGPGAAFYGNAAGGVLNINTFQEFDKNFIRGRLAYGIFNTRQIQVSGGYVNETHLFSASINHQYTNNYRAHSSHLSNQFSLKYRKKIAPKSQFDLQLTFTNSPFANDPGGLDIDAVAEDRQQARDRNVLFDTGEKINHLKVSGRFSGTIGKQWRFRSYAFFSSRDFEGRLPFEFGGIVSLNRMYWGQGSNITHTFSKRNLVNHLNIGYALAFQADNRKRFKNLEGVQGDLTFDQLESFENLGAFISNQLEYKKLLVSTSVRYDYNLLSANDYFLDNGDGSGEISPTAFSVALGVSFEFWKNSYVYGNFSNSFETPTLSELSENPMTGTGFYTDLRPQKGQNLEVGIKSQFLKKGQFRLALFSINTIDDLVPFELAAFPDRTFYQNVGKTKRQGIETSVKYQLLSNLTVSGSYALSNFTYENYSIDVDPNDGNRLPGIPVHWGQATLEYKSTKGLFIQWQNRFTGALFADDENETKVPSFALINLRAGRRFAYKNINLSPFVSVNNLTNVEYFDNIRLNADGNRYYEPAAGIQVFGGISFGF